MNEDGPAFPTYSTYPEKSHKGRSVFFILIGFIVLILIIAAGLFFLGSMHKKQPPVVKAPVIKPTTTPLPTASISAVLNENLTSVIAPTIGISKIDKNTKLNRSELSIAVLNGSGIAGAASQVASFLKGLGYNITKTDNADSYTYINLTVLVSKDKSAYAALLKKDLQANPAFASVSASVSDTLKSAAEVIVGK